MSSNVSSDEKTRHVMNISKADRRSDSASSLPGVPKKMKRNSNSTKAMSMMGADEAATTSSSKVDKSFEDSLNRLTARENELCSRRRMLTQEDVTSFAEVHRMLAQNCENDIQTMAVIGRMQKFLARDEVQRTLAVKRKPKAPTIPAIVQRFSDGFLTRWRAHADDLRDAEFQHYELQFGFRFMGSWTGVHLVSNTQYRATGLKPATTYLVRVRALNALGWSPFSEVAQITTRKLPKSPDQSESSGGVISMIGSIPDAYEELVNSIIRPPRAEYERHELGARRFRIGRKIYVRKDFTLLNSRNLNLHCSHWEPVPEQRAEKKIPMLIYLHGNCGCRVDAIECLEGALGGGMSLLGVDLSGSGHSEGEFITLGWNEKSDVKDIIKHMRKSGTVSDIFLWGRSMGAVTALLYASEPGAEKTISGIVLDSPFSDLWALALELVKSQNLSIPSVATGMAKMLIRSSVRSRTDVDINDLAPIKCVPNARVPALFCAARGDNFVRSHHSLALLDAYGGPKELQLIDGDHNSARPPSFMNLAIKFLQRSGGRRTIGSTTPPLPPTTKDAATKSGDAPRSATSATVAPASSKKGSDKNDIFNVKSMQANLFQSNKERQYAKGMAINEVLKAGDAKPPAAPSEGDGDGEE